MWVAIMGVILIYIYALIGFAFFRASFDTDESRFCRTLTECALATEHHSCHVVFIKDYTLLCQGYFWEQHIVYSYSYELFKFVVGKSTFSTKLSTFFSQKSNLNENNFLLLYISCSIVNFI